MAYIRNIEQEIIERDKFLKFVSERIKQIRLSKNTTIKELSKRTKIKESYLLKIEQGKATGVSLTQTILIAEILNVEPSELARGFCL